MTDFHQFASAHGLIIKNLDQGRWVRTPTTDKPRSRNGAFFYGGDYGFVQNWAEMTEVAVWQIDKPMTATDRAEMQKRMDTSRKAYAKERGIKQAIAAKKAKWILEQTELDRHAYLEKKGLPDIMGNVWHRPEQDPLLVVPMYCGGLVGVQLIGSTGEKKFLTGARTNDAVFSIGKGSRIFLCEGYASALSLHAILAALKVPYTIMATFSAGNLARIAKAHPGAFILADNDVSGTGQGVAQESGCKWWMPPEVGMDINDLHIQIGTFKASQMLRKNL